MKTALRLFSVLVAILTFPLLAAAQLETIDATARGTGTQLRHTVGIKLIITRYATPEDKQTLVNAFKQGQQRGLVNALQRMPSAGRIPGAAQRRRIEGIWRSLSRRANPGARCCRRGRHSNVNAAARAGRSAFRSAAHPNA